MHDFSCAEADALFSGLKIMSTGEEYLNHMSRYPLISIVLKSMKQTTYDHAFYSFKEEMDREYKRHDEIIAGLKYESDREKYLRIIKVRDRKRKSDTSRWEFQTARCGISIKRQFFAGLKKKWKRRI